MPQTMRFGRRLVVPSTRQIRHELLTMAAHDDARAKAIEARRVAVDEAPVPAVVLDDGIAV